ncbi:ERMES complex subunit [Oleoguttula sp. CCFEE 5521]
MAFNFNWSPLIADTERVRAMLTTALNKSPKPPIIVDDILVNELNLGPTPPDLEILEIGDLAEDRFRGIFKMSYTGDAYLTLKTRVQANPLNTYLSTKPSFASPQPLAASSGLTIPLQITLSDIRLSGFVILVFSKQKGVTLVFRNDPIESLKVSSTFDAIPFVREYLQRTIENQLRVLFMEDLPAIIHKLSLRMFNPEYQALEEIRSQAAEAVQSRVDPLSDSSAEAMGGERTPADGEVTETYGSFSQKNLLRLAALSESQRTLSLFTPSIRDTVYRAWAAAPARGDGVSGYSTPNPRLATLSRLNSSFDRSATLSSTASITSGTGSHITRPSLVSNASAPTTYTLGSGRPRPHAQRKRKHRVVNLRKTAVENDGSDAVSQSSGYDDSISASGSRSKDDNSSAIEPLDHLPSTLREGEVSTPPRSPKKIVGFTTDKADGVASSSTPSRRPITPLHKVIEPPEDDDPTPRASMVLPAKENEKRPQRHHLPRMQTLPSRPKGELYRSHSEVKIPDLSNAFNEGSTGGILEQAWMMKMASEIAKRVAEEKSGGERWRRTSEGGTSASTDAPPAYVS